MADLDLLQGTLDVLVLKTLTWGPRHGYAVARWIKDTSDGTITVESEVGRGTKFTLRFPARDDRTEQAAAS